MHIRQNNNFKTALLLSEKHYFVQKNVIFYIFLHETV